MYEMEQVHTESNILLNKSCKFLTRDHLPKMASSNSDDGWLKLIKTPDKGYGLAATKPIDKYITIVKETSAIHAIDVEGLATICSSCLKACSRGDLKQCGSCKVIRYCSVQCQRLDWPLHKTECKFLVLDPLFRMTSANTRSFFRCLVKAKSDPAFLKAFKDLSENKSHYLMHQEGYEMFFSRVEKFVPEVITQDLDMKSAWNILATNSFSSEFRDFNIIILLLYCSRFNHSCEPNAGWYIRGNTIYIITLKKILEGEEVYISYIDNFMPKIDRRSKLLHFMSFECNCSACASQVNDEIDISLHDESIPLRSRLDRIDAFRKNGKEHLFVYYMERLYPELNSKEDIRKFPEAAKILDMLFKKKGKNPELSVEVDDIRTRRILLTIGCICCAALGNMRVFHLALSKEFMHLTTLIPDSGNYL